MTSSEGGPIEFSFGCEIDNNGQSLNTTPTIAQPIAKVVVRAGPPPKTAAPKPTDIVKLAKERLKDVKRELAQMKALEQERAELERLIAAAEGAPKRPKKAKAATQKQ